MRWLPLQPAVCISKCQWTTSPACKVSVNHPRANTFGGDTTDSSRSTKTVNIPGCFAVSLPFNDAISLSQGSVIQHSHTNVHQINSGSRIIEQSIRFC